MFCGASKQRADSPFCDEDRSRLPASYQQTLSSLLARAASQGTAQAAASYQKAVDTAKTWLREHPAETVGAH